MRGATQVGFSATMGKRERGISDASPSLQTFRGGISKSAGVHSDSVSASEEPKAPGVGGRDSGRLCTAIGSSSQFSVLSSRVRREHFGCSSSGRGGYLQQVGGALKTVPITAYLAGKVAFGSGTCWSCFRFSVVRQLNFQRPSKGFCSTCSTFI